MTKIQNLITLLQVQRTNRWTKTKVFDSFLYARLKKGSYYGNTHGGQAGSVHNGVRSLIQTVLFRILTKLDGNVYGHEILVKFDNQPNRPRHFWVMPLDALKNEFWRAYFVTSVTLVIIQANFLLFMKKCIDIDLLSFDIFKRNPGLFNMLLFYLPSYLI